MSARSSGNINFISTNNSTSTPLGVSGVFTGTSDESTLFKSVMVSVFTDQSSATNGLSIEFSTDNVNWDFINQFTVTGNVSQTQTIDVTAQYMRVVYTNGIVIQTSFRLQTILTSQQDQTETTHVLNTFLSSTTNPQGEIIGVGYKVIVQPDHLMGIPSNNQIYTTFISGGGAIQSNSDGNAALLSISTGIGDFAVIRANRSIKYRPGFNTVVSCNVQFDGGAVANSLQFAGIGSALSDLYFAFSGTEFGIRRSTGGFLQIVELDMSAASSGVESAVVTLNSVVFNITLSDASSDLSFTAYEISVGGTTGVTYTRWNVENGENKVFFIGDAVGARNGTYTFSSSGTADGTFSTLKTGQDLTTEFVSVANWSEDSAMKNTIDPTQNNMYQIVYGWYGSSCILFKIMNPNTCMYETVHIMRFANITTEYSLSSPSLYIQRGIASLGSTTALQMQVSGSFSAVLGDFSIFGSPRASVANTRAISAGVETVILVCINRMQINGFTNNSDLFLEFLSASALGNRSVILRLIINPTTLSAGTTSDFVDTQFTNETEDIFTYDTTSLTYTGGITIFTEIIPTDSGIRFTLNDLQIILTQNEILIITAESVQTNTVDVSVNFLQDI